VSVSSFSTLYKFSLLNKGRIFKLGDEKALTINLNWLSSAFFNNIATIECPRKLLIFATATETIKVKQSYNDSEVQLLMYFTNPFNNFWWSKGEWVFQHKKHIVRKRVIFSLDLLNYPKWALSSWFFIISANVRDKALKFCLIEK